MPTDTLETLEEGDNVHDEETGEVYEVAEINAEFSEDGIPSGEVTFRDGDNTFIRDAEDVDFELHDNQLAIIDDAIIENAEAILVEFAEQEIGNYLQRLGLNHDYNGINHVDTLRDIKAAEFINRQEGN